MSQCGRPGACSQAWWCPQGGHMAACGAVELFPLVLATCPCHLSVLA